MNDITISSKNIDDLFSETDRWTGENIFYEDAQLKKEYNGVVVDYFKGVLSWEFEVKDGYKTGIEKIYYDTGELMEENETDHNTVNGIAKEYYKSGKLKSASIVLRNKQYTDYGKSQMIELFPKI